MNAEKSPLDFRVRKEELKTVTGVPIEGKCALVREDTNQAISIVGNKFGVIQNDVLFPELNDIVFSSIPDSHGTAKIVDRTAYNGRICYRDYVFPSEVVTEGEGTWHGDGVTDLGFMLTLVNGFGGTSLQLYGGAIDYYCSNGLVNAGQRDIMYRLRHSRRIEVFAMEEAVEKAVDQFNFNRKVWKEWSETELTNDQVSKFLEDNADSKAFGKKIFNQWLNEKGVRGSNLWALLSAFTNYASHTDSGPFAVRNTGRDSEAATRMSRMQRVARMAESPEFLALAA